MNNRGSGSDWKHRRDGDRPGYGFDPSLAGPAHDDPLTRERHANHLSGHAPGFWCNVCNEFCGSNEALREHYRVAHPALAAQIEAHMADQGNREKR